MKNFDNYNIEIQLDESMQNKVKVSLLLLFSLLSVPGIADVDDFKNKLSNNTAISNNNITPNDLQQSLKDIGNEKQMTFGGYSALAAANIIARTLYYEARSEGKVGIDAVASVILNRANADPEKLTGVCLAKGQFSCWNNRTDLTPDKYKIVVPKETLTAAKDKEMWTYCKKVAGMLLFKEFKSTIGNRNAYHTTKVKPYWDNFLTDKQTIGNHVFGYLQEYDANRKIYTIKKGDTLSKIAAAHNITLDKLTAANKKLDPKRLKIGSKIVIPS